MLPLLLTWWSGALPAFLEYAFLGKGAYVRFARVSYLGGFRAASSPLWQAAYLLPPLAWAGLAGTWRTVRGPERHRIVILAAFCAAATVGLFPLAEEVHLAYAAAAAHGVRRDRDGRGRRHGGLRAVQAALVRPVERRRC